MSLKLIFLLILIISGVFISLNSFDISISVKKENNTIIKTMPDQINKFMRSINVTEPETINSTKLQ